MLSLLAPDCKAFYKRFVLTMQFIGSIYRGNRRLWKRNCGFRCLAILVSKLEETEKGKDIVKKLLEVDSRKGFGKYLEQQNWTVKDMTGSEWQTDKYGYIYYGKQTNNNLKNTNGIRISPGGMLLITHFTQYGDLLIPTSGALQTSLEFMSE